MAEENEKERNYEQAIKEYKAASDYFEMDKSSQKSNLTNCLVKQADLMCLTDHPQAFEETKQIYEKVGMEYLSAPLRKLSAKDMFVKCVIVYFVYEDYVAADSYLSKFLNEDISMQGTSEEILLRALIDAAKERDPPRFQIAFTKYKRSNNVDNWMVTMLAKALTKIDSQPQGMMLGNDDDYK
jgi:hypothetical protein